MTRSGRDGWGLHPALPFGLWLPVVIASVYLGYRAGQSALSLAGLAAGGWLAWTLVEYALHRWVFHWKPPNGRLRRLLRPLHQAHHETQEWDRIVVHPLFAAPLALAFLGVFRAALGSPAVFPFFGGFTLGYLAYEYVHLRAHFGRPGPRPLRSLRRRHLEHHFKCPDRWFGVSWPVWDYVFRTHFPRRLGPSLHQPLGPGPDLRPKRQIARHDSQAAEP